jgi:hypothetical protein
MLYQIIIVIGGFVQALVRDRLIVSGDATAAAERIISSELLWRASIAGGLFMLRPAPWLWR